MEIRQQTIATYNGHSIIEYQMIAANGFQVNFLNYGGIITGIYVADKNGKLDNVVLKHPQFTPDNPGHFGAIIGRIAGRIAEAKFELNNQHYLLTANNGKHTLHGGRGLDKQIWKVEILSNGVCLSYISQDLDNGFPGTISFSVNYLISEENTLILEYSAIPDCTTIINLTQHSYFDLTSGECPLAQELCLNADFYAEIDADGLPLGIISKVDNSPFDFRQTKPIGRDIYADHSQLKLAQGYDHPFILNTNSPIVLSDRSSLRYLQINTDQSVCVLYTANHINHCGICLETQAMPNAINWPKYRESVIYSPNTPYYSYNIWKFGIII